MNKTEIDIWAIGTIAGVTCFKLSEYRNIHKRTCQPIRMPIEQTNKKTKNKKRKNIKQKKKQTKKTSKKKKKTENLFVVCFLAD